MKLEQPRLNQWMKIRAYRRLQAMCLLRAGPIITLLCLPNPAVAFSIEEVKLFPSGTIWPSDEVELEVTILTPSMPEWLYHPTEITYDADEIFVEIFQDSSPLDAIGTLYETVRLGTFQAGVYDYTILLTPAYQVGWGIRKVQGQFAVEPLADFDGDGNVDDSDFLIWQVGFNDPNLQIGDADGNDEADADDLAIWQSQFGNHGGGMAIARIPEPTTCMLVVLLIFGTLICHAANFSVLSCRRVL